MFASLVLFVFHNWAHPNDRPVLGGFFFEINFIRAQHYPTEYAFPSSLKTVSGKTSCA